MPTALTFILSAEGVNLKQRDQVTLEAVGHDVYGFLCHEIRQRADITAPVGFKSIVFIDTDVLT